jgi:hypothetical protein
MRLPYSALLLLLLISGLHPSPARADDVTEQIDQALAAYQKHDLPVAVAALEAAANLLRQTEADALKAVLPPPPSGWNADQVDTSAVGVAMLGGGTTVGRTYHNGAQQVEVQIITDSPMLQGMAALINSPLAAAAGMKTVVIGGRPMSYAPNDNSFMTLVAGRTIVKVAGNKATPEPALHGFIAAVDFAALEKLAH